MLNPVESAQDIKKYLRKLLKLIDQEAMFTFFKTKLVDKSRADDIICCIEASFTDEYKNFVKKTGGKKLKSYGLWQRALAAIKNRYFLSSSVYSVRTTEAMQTISGVISTIDSDIKFLYGEASGMF